MVPPSLIVALHCVYGVSTVGAVGVADNAVVSVVNAMPAIVASKDARPAAGNLTDSLSTKQPTATFPVEVSACHSSNVIVFHVVPVFSTFVAHVLNIAVCNSGEKFVC